VTKREVPIDPQSPIGGDQYDEGWERLAGPNSHLATIGRGAFPSREGGELRALMECAPYEEPPSSTDDLLHLRDIIQDAIEMLTEREQWVFNAHACERLSFREIGQQLNVGKTTAFDIYHRATETLRNILDECPAIVTHINQETT